MEGVPRADGGRSLGRPGPRLGGSGARGGRLVKRMAMRAAERRRRDCGEVGGRCGGMSGVECWVWRGWRFRDGEWVRRVEKMDVMGGGRGVVFLARGGRPGPRLGGGGRKGGRESMCAERRIAERRRGAVGGCLESVGSWREERFWVGLGCGRRGNIVRIEGGRGRTGLGWGGRPGPLLGGGVEEKVGGLGGSSE